MTESGAHAAVERAALPCERCRARVVWTWTERGKRMPVNLAPDPAGNTAVRVDATGRIRSRSLGGERPDLEGAERRHVPHAATCGRTATGAVPVRSDGVTPLYLARERRAERDRLAGRPGRPGRPGPAGGPR